MELKNILLSENVYSYYLKISEKMDKLKEEYPGIKGLRRLRDLFLDEFDISSIFLGLTDDLDVNYTSSVSVIPTEIANSLTTGSVIPLPFASAVLVNDNEATRPYLFTAIYEVLSTRVIYLGELENIQKKAILLLKDALQGKENEIYYALHGIELSDESLKLVVHHEGSRKKYNEFYFRSYQIAKKMGDKFSDVMLFPVILMKEGLYPYLDKDILLSMQTLLND